MLKFCYIIGILTLTSCSDYKLYAQKDGSPKPAIVVVDSGEPESPEPDPPEPDTGEPDPPPPPTYPDIEVSPTFINFGNLNAIGDVGSKTVSIKNVGTADLNVSDIRLNTASVVYRLIALGSTNLIPGQSSTFIVEYDPITYETNADSIIIVSNDPDESPVVVPILGSGSAPIIEIDPDYHDFGTTLIGCDGEKEIVVSNVGDVDLIVSSLDFYVSYPAEMLIDLYEEINGPLPWTISAGSSKNVLIAHEPYDELTDSGFIEVGSNDPVTPTSSCRSGS